MFHTRTAAGANVGTITTTFRDGSAVDTDPVMVDTVRDDGRVRTIRTPRRG